MLIMKPKVTILVGGQWHSFDLAKALHSQGYLYRLITTYPLSRTRKFAIPDDKVISLPLSLLLHKIANKIGGDYITTKIQYLLCQLFAQKATKYLSGSDIIHGWSSFSEPAMIWAKTHQIPFVLYRGSAHIQQQSLILRAEYQKLGLKWSETHPQTVAQELREYDLADKISVPSLFVKHSFLHQGFSEDKLYHNSLAANINFFTPNVKQDDIFRVIYAGTLSIRKGVHYLVKAFQQANIKNSQLYLVGGQTLETKLLLTNVDDNVIITGQVSQQKLVHYYQNSSVFVMPSVEEGLATVQAQALACGLPLICTTNTGGEDLLKMSGEPVELTGNIYEYPAGYLVPVGDSEAIALCLQILANNVNIHQQKQKAALSLRNKNLSWDDYAQRAIKLYNSLIT
jgi:alpha-maltose-1-phosphate synthase